MIAVVLDTNAIHRDPWLGNRPGVRLTRLAASGACEVILPEVVVRELRRQQQEQVEQSRRDATALMERMSKQGEVLDAVAAQLSSAFASLDSKVEDNFNALLARDGVIREPIPPGSTERIVSRDLSHRRPFLEIGPDRVSAGFRDAVIWETVLGLLDSGRGYDKVVFVTDDNGFLADKGGGLHADLLADLAELDVDRERVVNVRTVWNAAAQVESFREATAEAAENARLVTVATNVLLALQTENVSLQMVYGGDYDYPAFVQFGFAPMEDATIDHIEQLSEFRLARDESTGRVVATAEARLDLTGFMSKSDWFADGGESISMLDDWNDHYFRVADESAVTVIVEIDVGGPEPVAVDIKLVGDRHRQAGAAPEPGGDR